MGDVHSFRPRNQVQGTGAAVDAQQAAPERLEGEDRLELLTRYRMVVTRGMKVYGVSIPDESGLGVLPFDAMVSEVFDRGRSGPLLVRARQETDEMARVMTVCYAVMADCYTLLQQQEVLNEQSISSACHAAVAHVNNALAKAEPRIGLTDERWRHIDTIMREKLLELLYDIAGQQAGRTV